MKASPQAKLGAEIRRLRIAKGLTLKALAERASIHPHYLSEIEQALVDVSHAILVRIAGALHIKAGLLFGPLPKLTEKAMEAGRMFDKADPEIQRGVLVILRVMAREGRKATRAAKRKRTK